MQPPEHAQQETPTSRSSLIYLRAVQPPGVVVSSSFCVLKVARDVDRSVHHCFLHAITRPSESVDACRRVSSPFATHAPKWAFDIYCSRIPQAEGTRAVVLSRLRRGLTPWHQENPAPSQNFDIFHGLEIDRCMLMPTYGIHMNCRTARSLGLQFLVDVAVVVIRQVLVAPRARASPREPLR